MAIDTFRQDIVDLIRRVFAVLQVAFYMDEGVIKLCKWNFIRCLLAGNYNMGNT